MTTPRDALAAALTNSHPCPDPDMHAEDAVIVLSALAAEGWVLVRRGDVFWDEKAHEVTLRDAKEPQP